jgi:hypothetical protein
MKARADTVRASAVKVAAPPTTGEGADEAAGATGFRGLCAFMLIIL